MRFLLTATLLFTLAGAQEKLSNRLVAASVLLPGSGELLSGNRAAGEAFLWADGVLWLVWGTAYWFGSTQNHNARIYAVENAGAPFNQKTAYYDILEDYDNSDDYNTQLMRDARQRYPDTLADAPQKRLEYLQKHGYFGADGWNWNPDSLRTTGYWEIRRSARVALQRASFAMGGLVLNRLVSVVDCLFFAKEKPLSKKIGFVPTENKPGLGVVYRF